jgi:hypothetical protein
MPVQLSLFDDTSRQILAAGGFVAGMKAAMRAIVAESGMSRDHVIDAMNDIVRATGKGLCKGSKFIKIDTLEKWLACEERAQLPDLWGLHVLMLVTGSKLHPLEVWAALFDCALLDSAGRDKLEFAELELERESRDKRRRELKSRLLERK